MAELHPEPPDTSTAFAPLGPREYLRRVVIAALNETARLFRKGTTESLAVGAIFGGFQLLFITYYTWVSDGWNSVRVMLKAVGFALVPIVILAVVLFVWSALKQSYLFVNETRQTASATIESRNRELSEAHEAFDAHLKVCVARSASQKRPRVTLTLSETAVEGIACSDGDPALNVLGTCALSTSRVIQFGPVSRVGTDPTSVPIRLIQDGKHLFTGARGLLTRDDVNEFVMYARKEAIYDAMEETNSLRLRGALPPEATEEELRAMFDKLLVEQGMLPAKEFVKPFEVTYTDFDRHLRYHTPHLLRHSGRDTYLRVEPAEVPEPEPTAI